MSVQATVVFPIVDGREFSSAWYPHRWGRTSGDSVAPRLLPQPVNLAAAVGGGTKLEVSWFGRLRRLGDRPRMCLMEYPPIGPPGDEGRGLFNQRAFIDQLFFSAKRAVRLPELQETLPERQERSPERQEGSPERQEGSPERQEEKEKLPLRCQGRRLHYDLAPIRRVEIELQLNGGGLKPESILHSLVSLQIRIPVPSTRSSGRRANAEQNRAAKRELWAGSLLEGSGKLKELFRHATTPSGVKQKTFEHAPLECAEPLMVIKVGASSVGPFVDTKLFEPITSAIEVRNGPQEVTFGRLNHETACNIFIVRQKGGDPGRTNTLVRELIHIYVRHQALLHVLRWFETRTINYKKNSICGSLITNYINRETKFLNRHISGKLVDAEDVPREVMRIQEIINPNESARCIKSLRKIHRQICQKLKHYFVDYEDGG